MNFYIHKRKFIAFFPGDGNVSFDEFVEILSKMVDEEKAGINPSEQEERELRDAFRIFDKHNRGYITASDLRAVLQCLGENMGEDESKLPCRGSDPGRTNFAFPLFTPIKNKLNFSMQLKI